MALFWITHNPKPQPTRLSPRAAAVVLSLASGQSSASDGTAKS